MQIIEATRRAWIRLPSGRHLDLINPSPDAWLDSDLAIRLSRTYRWGGESRWPLPLSVAQHSLFVLALRRQMSDAPLSLVVSLQELLHDAEEGFLGFDCISPLKAVLGKPFQDVSNRLMRTICARYDVPPWREDDYVLHKQADLIAAASEAVHCIGWSHEEVRNVLGISHPILETDPLSTVYGDEPWMPWPAELATERFLDALSNLLQSGRKEVSQLA